MEIRKYLNIIIIKIEHKERGGRNNSTYKNSQHILENTKRLRINGYTSFQELGKEERIKA